MATDMIDIEKVCRLCLREDDIKCKLISLYENEQQVKDIQYCLQIEVNLRSCEPTNICENCKVTLNTFNKFKMLCENVNSTIQSYVQEKNEPALELNSEMMIDIANMETPGFTPSQMSEINPDFFDSDSILWNNELQQWMGDVDTGRTDLPTSKCVKQVQPPTDFVFDTMSNEECMSTGLNESSEKNDHVIHTTTHCWNPKAISMRKMQKENEEPISEKTVSKSMMKYNQNVRKTFHCHLCPEYYTKFFELLIHDSTVHSDISKEFSCKTCGKLFLSLGRLETHKLVHREKLFQCQLCQKKFAAQKTLDRHLNIHIGLYICGKCGYKADDMTNLKVHESIHSTVKKHCCNECGKQFAILSSLSRHNRLVHQKSNLYRCNQCDYSTIHLSCFKYHKEASHVSLKFICHNCGVWFRTEELLTKHFKIHNTSEQFTCSLCDKLFKTKNYLKQHLINHHEMGSKKYQCSKCEKYFKNKRNVQHHVIKKVCLSNYDNGTPELIIHELPIVYA